MHDVALDLLILLAGIWLVAVTLRPLGPLINRALGILAVDDPKVVTGCCLRQRALSRMLTLV